MYTIPEYVYDTLVYATEHPEAADLNVAQAMLINEAPEKRNHELDREMREFQGRYYLELINIYKNTSSKDEFLNKVNPLYEGYAADVANYEKSKKED